MEALLNILYIFTREQPYSCDSHVTVLCCVSMMYRILLPMCMFIRFSHKILMPDRYIFAVCLNVLHIIKKAGQLFSATRPAIQGSRIAHAKQNEQHAEAHAICNNTPYLPTMHVYRKTRVVYTYNSELYRCFALVCVLELARF